MSAATTAKRFGMFAMSLGFVLMSAGCEVVGTVLHRTVGDPPVPAMYTPRSVPTLVYVDNVVNPDAGRIDGDQIAHLVVAELKSQANMELISPDKIVQIREEQPDAYHDMNIQAIGKLTGATQIIYVDLREASASKDATQGAIHAVAQAWVRVVDVETGRTLWPVDSARGREVDSNTEYDPVETRTARAMHTHMLTDVSSKIAKMFYTWKPDNQDQENAGG